MAYLQKLATQFQVAAGERVDLKKRPTRVEPIFESKTEYQQMLAAHVEKMSALQSVLYASGTYAVLIIFQGMDAAGKDGCIKHVLSGVNPHGCHVVSFSQPSSVELKHDFLWRTTLALPERGRIGIFNRSYYEEVLVARVHPSILEAQAIPKTSRNGDVWTERFSSITSHERHLHFNGTRIIKFFLHVSRDEQRRRLLERIDKPEKNWKIKPSDIEARKEWGDYQKAYEGCLEETSTRDAPWYVIPADDKHAARLIVSHIIMTMLDSLDMAYPQSTPEHRAELQALRSQLEND